MTITIREALQLPDMVHTKLVAGANGIDKQIRWVTIVEILEDANRLQEGEFLITTGFGLEASPDKLSQFIPSLAKRGLSGVAIHTGFYLREIPQTFIEEADRYSLPLIEIPTELNFSTITKAMLTPIMNRQFEILSYSQAIHDQMIRVALSGKGLAAIAQELSALTQGEVKITDSLGYELVSHPHPAEETEPKHVRRSVPIQAADDTYGEITLIKPAENWKDLDQVALQHASTLCALELVKDRAIAETEWRMQGDFVEEMLSGRTEWSAEVEARSRMLGYPLTGRHLVVQLLVHGLQDPVEISAAHQKLTALIKRQAHKSQVSYLLKERSQHLLLILHQSPNSVSFLEQISAQWMKVQQERALHIGVSNEVTKLPLFAQAAEEAHFAALVYPLLKEAGIPSILFFKEMSGYQFLFSFYRDQHLLKTLWEPYLTAIIAYDERHGQHLLKTLDVYLQTNLNGLRAAQLLYIHRHTLKYRLQQIVEKTGLDMETAAHRWQLQLAIMAYRLHKLLYPL